jgi:hypothetical protein
LGHAAGCTERAYLQFIIDMGYPACPVERIAAGAPVEETDESADAADVEKGAKLPS